MGNTIFVFSHDPDFVGQVQQRVSQADELIAVESIDAIRRHASLGCKAMVAHLCAATLGQRTPGELLERLAQAVDRAPLLPVIDAACPPQLAQAARDASDACIGGADWLDRLVAWVGRCPIPLESMIDCRPGSAYRAVHGRSRSLVTFTPSMFSVLDEMQIASEHDVTVLLNGETGAGKTHLSRLIHELSPRHEERFCTVACGALPPDLVESELFGHAKGAFTGAERDKLGKFAAAGKGTLLLDEIDVLPLDQQAKLLRVIDTGEYEMVGCNDTQISQARLIVASNYELEGLVEQGKFRSDLFYRLNILRIHLPPLRERPLDVEFLARKFALDHSRRHRIELREVEPAFLTALHRYAWPGNVRELENVIRRAVLYCRDGVLRVSDLPSPLQPDIESAPPAAAAGEPHQPSTLESRVGRFEQRVIEESLVRHNQHRTATARELGISRVTLYNKMKKFGMLS